MIQETFCKLWNNNTEQYPGELFLFIEYVEKLSPKIILEIGVSDGGTIRFWSHIVGIDGLAIGIDIKIKEFARNKNMKFVEGSSLELSTEFSIRKILHYRKIDMLFIDGCHDKKNVKWDYEIYYEYVRPGGMIAFQDIDWGGTHEVFYSLMSKKYFVNTSETLPKTINNLRTDKNKHDYAMSRTNTIGWIYKQ